MGDVSTLADELGLAPHIVRTKLRGAGIPKVDGKYQWDKKSEYAAVVKALKNGDKAEPKAKAEAEPKAKTKKSKKDAGAAPENKAVGKKKKKKSA